MDEQFGVGLKPHDIARLLISTWRGSCMDIYARGEKIIGQTLEAIRSDAKDPKAIKLEHLGGQRSKALASQLEQLPLTEKQAKAMKSALEIWRKYEEQRTFLAQQQLTSPLTVNEIGMPYSI